MSLSGRTIAALKRAQITNPTQFRLGSLLQLPGIGVKAIMEIAEHAYANQYAYREEWAVLLDQPKPKPPQRCSHRVLLTDTCSKCAADLEMRR